ncbi:hypothetical protein Tco_1355147 [Tanacetum coccineum]
MLITGKKIDDPNITMEEYIKLEKEKARRHGRTFNWQTATFEKVIYHEDKDDCFTDFETKFPAIVFDNTLTFDTTLLCAPTIISVNDLKKDSENYEILKPSPSEPTVDYLDALDYFNDFENEFPAIVYNDSLTSKPDLEIEPLKEEEKRIAKEQAAKDRYWKIPICYDDDEDYTIAIAPISSTKEPLSKNISEIVVDFNDDSTSSDDDSPYGEDIDYVDASPPDVEINSSGSTTTRSDYSLPDYEAFYDDHIEEKSSGSTTTHADFSQYDSFIFDLSINPIPPADRSDFYHEKFADELAHIISPSEYDHFCFKIEPELGNLTMDVVEDIFPTREPRIHVPNVLPTHSHLNWIWIFILLSTSLRNIVWSSSLLTYPVGSTLSSILWE